MISELRKYHDESEYYSFDNILFTKTIQVDFYITAEHIVFLLHVPLLDKRIYNLYHLYSVPTKGNSTIIAPTPYVAMTEDSIYYLKSNCLSLQQQYFCATNDIEKNFQQDTCIKNLLQVKNDPNCRLIPIEINDTLVETISDQKYLLILPVETLVHIKCQNEEVHKLKGTFLLDVPYSCSFITKDFVYKNLEGTLKEEPVYLPPLSKQQAAIKPIHLNLKAINLDQLSKLTLETSEPLTYITPLSTTWFHWNIPLYCLIILIIIALLVYFKKDSLIKYTRLRKKSKPQIVKIEACPLPTEST